MQLYGLSEIINSNSYLLFFRVPSLMIIPIADCGESFVTLSKPTLVGLDARVLPQVNRQVPLFDKPFVTVLAIVPYYIMKMSSFLVKPKSLETSVPLVTVCALESFKAYLLSMFSLYCFV